jgi:endoglucanase
MPIARRTPRRVLSLAGCLLGAALSLFSSILPAAAVRAQAAPATAGHYLHTSGSKIVDADGREVRLTGMSWFGMETDVLAPHGLWSRNWQEMLDQLAGLGYNTIRLPYSNELFDPSLQPQGIDYSLNPDLKGLSGIQIMDKIIEGAGKRGLKVILDQHRPTTDSQSKLWYTDELPESQWIADWQALARRYKDNDTVIGADLHNEPAGDATWGTDDPKTDWRLAAERGGNAILEVNPNWLIIVEGIEKTQDAFGNVMDWYWMGGSLQDARFAPVRLNVPDRLVYSAHDYGPSVYLQGWFQDPEYPKNLPDVWDHHWGYLAKENIAPVLLGEFGGVSVGDDVEGVWQRALVDYLKQNGISYTYWAFNGNSGDVGGLLGADWKTVDAGKQKMLADYQGTQLAVANPSAVDLAAVPTWNASLAKLIKGLHQDKQDAKWAPSMTPEVYVENKSQAELPLKGVEMRYWYNPGNDAAALGAAGQTVAVDWAGIGIGDGAKEVSKEKVKAEVVVDQRGRGIDPLYYVKVTFADGMSVPARSALGVRLKIANKSGAMFFQEASYSYRQYHWPTEWDQIGILKDGKLVWGIDPNDFDAQQRARRIELEQRSAVQTSPESQSQSQSQSQPQQSPQSKASSFIHSILPFLP